MSKLRLRKKDRIQLAGKGNNKAQYVWGKAKREGKLFRQFQYDGKQVATHEKYYAVIH